MTKIVSAADARKDFANLLNLVAFNGARIVVERYGEPVAEIVPTIKETKTKKDWEKIVRGYAGMWKDYDWAKDIGRPSRYFRDRDLWR